MYRYRAPSRPARARRVALGLAALLAALLAAGCADRAARHRRLAARRRAGAPARRRARPARASAPAPPRPSERDLALRHRRHHHGQRAEPAAPQRRQGLLRPVTDGAQGRPGDGQPGGAVDRRHRHRQVRANSTRCFQFRAPPEYAAHLRDAGFDAAQPGQQPRLRLRARRATRTPRRRWRSTASSTPARRTRSPWSTSRASRSRWPASRRTSGPTAWSTSPRRSGWSPRPPTMADLVVVQVHMGARGRRQDPGEAGHRDVPRREPGRPGQVLPRR